MIPDKIYVAFSERWIKVHSDEKNKDDLEYIRVDKIKEIINNCLMFPNKDGFNEIWNTAIRKVDSKLQELLND